MAGDNDPTIYDAKSADRIDAVVKAVEAQRPVDTLTSQQHSETLTLWAKITGATLVATQWRHSWEEYRRDTPTAPTFTAYPSEAAATGTTTERFAVNVDGARTEDDALVLLRLDDQEGGLIWTIVFVPPPLLCVNLSVDGGSGGDQTTQCDWTYTATSIGGTVMDTSMDYGPRPDVGEVLPATRGVIYYQGASWILWLCNEVANAVACDP